MNANAITEQILSDARAEAALILAEASKRAEGERLASERALFALRDEEYARAKAQAAELRSRTLRMAELEQQKELLAMKREALDQAFEAAVQRLIAMPEGVLRDFVARLLIENAEGDEEIIVSVKDAPIYDDGFLQEINGRLIAAGKPGRLRLSDQRRALRGGFVLARGKIELRCTFDALVAQHRPEMELFVAQMLFDEPEGAS